MLRSSGRSKERVLAYGLEGCGKSLTALDVAANIHPHTLFVIDNDNAWDRMLEGQTLDGRQVDVREEYRWNDRLLHKDADGNNQPGNWELDDRWCKATGNVVVYHADAGWLSNVQGIQAVKDAASHDDWCCVDSGSALWDDVQEFFTNSVFDKTMSGYFLQIRMEMEKAKDQSAALGALDGWRDYAVINPMYKDAVMKFLVTPPCHLIVTAEQADVQGASGSGKQMEDKETRALYGGQQVKPRTQKRMGHNMQTVLRMERKAGDRYTVTTVKDRGGRERLEAEDVTDRGFSEWYLRDVAGWTDEETSTPSATAQTALAAKMAVKKS